MISLIKLYTEGGKVVRHEDWYVFIYFTCLVLRTKQEYLNLQFNKENVEHSFVPLPWDNNIVFSVCENVRGNL